MSKLVHLVSFIIRIYHDALSCERQKWIIFNEQYNVSVCLNIATVISILPIKTLFTSIGEKWLVWSYKSVNNQFNPIIYIWYI